ncbi:hypothetical protein PAEPH01_2278 [Pancytospora epiphaga]|nr:hypothetical protein PAEPH01_2278 [Pancytospora epiphaga]
MDYYSVDSILAAEEKIQVTFRHQIDNFGFYISPSLQSIRANIRADLPFFLVAFLLRNGHCKLATSQLLEIKDDLDADASIVDLSNSHFFVLNSYYENTRYLASVLFERLSIHAALIVKEDFSENDLLIMDYSERAYLIKSRENFKMFQDFFLGASSDDSWDVGIKK